MIKLVLLTEFPVHKISKLGVQMSAKLDCTLFIIVQMFTFILGKNVSIKTKNLRRYFVFIFEFNTNKMFLSSSKIPLLMFKIYLVLRSIAYSSRDGVYFF